MPVAPQRENSVNHILKRTGQITNRPQAFLRACLRGPLPVELLVDSHDGVAHLHQQLATLTAMIVEEAIAGREARLQLGGKLCAHLVEERPRAWRSCEAARVSRA